MLGLRLSSSISVSIEIKELTRRMYNRRKFCTVFQIDGSGDVANLLMKLLMTILVVDWFLKFRCSEGMMGQLTYF